MIFDFFKTSDYKDYKEEAMDYNTTPLVDSVKVSPKHDYSVGIDYEGNTVLKLYSGNTAMSMTLSQSGVRQLVRMLEATLPDADDWK